ncbi:MAG: hypothetical protein ACFFAO_07825 [Candidatus Hermodarchaeota archaeon]
MNDEQLCPNCGESVEGELIACLDCGNAICEECSYICKKCHEYFCDSCYRSHKKTCK